MIKSSFIPPPDIRHLHDLLRLRMKLTYQITGMKNLALNCLTVSNLKLDDVFSGVFDKSSRSIIQQILENSGVRFNVSHYVDKRCKHPIEEIQAAIDGAIPPQRSSDSIRLFMSSASCSSTSKSDIVLKSFSASVQ